MAASLLAHLQQQLQERWQLQADHALLSSLQRCSKAAVPGWLAQQRERHAAV